MRQLLDPVPRAVPAVYQPLVWPAGARHPLAPRDAALQLDLCALLEQRQTRREFNTALTDVALGEFFWLACRNRSSRPSPFGPDQESRVHPSGGAMHPIHVLCARAGGPWMRYDAAEHALIELPNSRDSVRAGRDEAQRLLAIDQGMLLGLVAEVGKTAAKYEHPESVIWRDAGVVLGYMSIIAEALDLSFCPLGIIGHPYLTSAVPHPLGLEAMGLAVLGLA